LLLLETLLRTWKAKSKSRKKIFTKCTSDKGLVFRIYSTPLQLNKKTINSNKNRQKYLNRHLTKEDTNTWGINTWKWALYHQSFRKCKLKSHWDTATHLVKLLKLKRMTMASDKNKTNRQWPLLSAAETWNSHLYCCDIKWKSHTVG
jgi:hypothetical protein